MNTANQLTLSRIAVVPFFLIALVPQSFGLPEGWNPLMRVAALALFAAASITDYYDGLLARRHGWSTNFGRLMDPLADKILVMTAFGGLVELRVLPAWMVAVVLAREFLITGLRQLALAQGRVLGADRWGKNKTISQMVTIVTALLYLAARDWLEQRGLWERVIVRQWDIAWVFNLILHAMMGICVVLTVVSGWRYGWANRDVFREAPRP